jgi:hypothetical protein
MLLPQADAVNVITEVLEHLADWPIKTAAGFRNAVLEGGFAVNPLLNIKKEEDALFLKAGIETTVREGRMIDFGFLPNDLIKLESVRSRKMFEAQEFDLPYEIWLGVARWEGGMNGYLFSQSPYNPTDITAIELYGVTIPHLGDLILVYDVISIDIGTPTRVRVADFGAPQTVEDMEARGANSLDPLVTFLRLLADASIPVADIPEPVKLNKARAKHGKLPIPPHTEVCTRDYVVAFRSASTATGEGRGGHHASPVAHWRRAHHRRLASGKVVPVRSSKVNWRDTAEMHRLFYRVPK